MHRRCRFLPLAVTMLLIGTILFPASCMLPGRAPSPTVKPTVVPTLTMTPTSTTTPSPSPSPSPSPTRTPWPTTTPSPTPSPTPTPRPPLAYGVSVHLYEMNRGRVLDIARETGFEWIRQQIWWRYLEPWKGYYLWGDLDDIVAQAEARGLKVFLSIVRAPAWAAGGGHGMPHNPEDLGDLLYAMASRYRGRVHAYEIWNEPNLAVENAGRVADPEVYVNLLSVAYRRIKEADPAARVISAPLTPTGITNPWISTDDIDYFRALLASQDGLFLASCDAVGVHAAGSNNPPDTYWPDNPGPGEWTTHPTFYFRHAQDYHAILVEFNVEKPIWITEFGWATANYTPGYGYGYDNSEQDQADYIVRAYQIAEREWPYVEGIFLWNLNFSVARGNWHEQGAFSILYSNWSPRPAFWAVQQYLERVHRPTPTPAPWQRR